MVETALGLSGLSFITACGEIGAYVVCCSYVVAIVMNVLLLGYSLRCSLF